MRGNKKGKNKKLPKLKFSAMLQLQLSIPPHIQD
jgi:hypothetical protein